MLNYRQISGILLLAGLWGPLFLLIKLSVQYFSPITMVFVRCILSTAVLFFFIFAQKLPLAEHFRRIKHLCGVSIIGIVVPFTLCAYAEISADSGTAGILDGLIPVFTVVLSWLFIRGRKIHKHEFLGIFLGFIGLSIIFFPNIKSLENDSITGLMMLIGASAAWALSFVYAEKTLKGLGPMQTIAIQQFIAATTLAPLAFIFEKPSKIMTVPWQGWMALLTLSCFVAVSGVWYYKLLRTISASYISFATYLSPPISIILGAIVLSEILPWNFYLGSIAILVSMLVVGGIFQRFTNSTRVEAPNAN